MPSTGSKAQKALDRKMYDAVKAGKFEVAKALLEQDANPNAPVGRKGMTAMHRVAKAGDRKLELMLEDFGGRRYRTARQANFSPDPDSEDEDVTFRPGDKVSLSPNAVDELDAMYGPLTGPDDVGTVVAVNPNEKAAVLVESKSKEQFRYTPQALMPAKLMQRARSIKEIAAPRPDEAQVIIDKVRNVRNMAAHMEKYGQEILQQKGVRHVKEGGMSRLAAGTQKSLRSRVRHLESISKDAPARNNPMVNELKAELSNLSITSKVASGVAKSKQIEAAAAAQPSPSATKSTTVVEKAVYPVATATAHGLDFDSIPVYKPEPEQTTVRASSKSPKRDVQFDIKKVKIGPKLGEGNFGVVYAGEATGLIPNQKVTKVAIKQLSDHSDDGGMRDEFMTESEIMIDLDGSDKVVKLLGICSKEEPFCMLMELMSRGDLKQVLRQHRPKKKKASIFSWKQLTGMAVDIAEGMAYLAGKKIVHRDLAARNCLVNDEYTVKIGDFGLTRNVYSQEYYRCTGSAPLPIRWMSPESLTDGVSTGMSDVWSFGVVLWEIATFAKLPYGLLSNMEVCEMVCEEDYRMPIPKGCPPELYKIMTDCWQENETDRPAFKYLFESLSKYQSKAPKEDIVYVKKSDTDQAIAAAPTVPQDSYMIPAMPDAMDSDNDDSRDNEPAHYLGIGSSSPEKLTQNESQPIADKKQSFASSGFMKAAQQGSVASVASAVASQAAAFKNEGGAQHKATNKGPKRADIAGMTTEVCDWIKGVSGEAIEPESLQSRLKSGTVLCGLVNALKPGTTRKPHTKKLAAMHRENIGWFLASLDGFGVPGSDQFMTNDLYDDANMKQVLICLLSLKRHID